MYTSPDIKNLQPYQPGKPISETQRQYGLKKVVKLASNENSLGLSPQVAKALQQAVQGQFRYPDAACYDLVQSLSLKWNQKPAQIGVGNGSNEIIDLLIRIYCEPGDAILTSELAFIAYAVCAQAARVQRLRAPVKAKYSLDLEAFAKILRADANSRKIKLVFIPNPNNPTGTYVADPEIKAFLDEFAHDPLRLIVFDEAYTEFVRASDCHSVMSLMQNYESLVVIKTMAKAYGLAGLRVGVVVAPEAIIADFNRVRNPFNVNDLAQVAAVAALQDDDFLRKSVQATWQGLDYFYVELRKMNIPFVESQGNFVMFDTLRNVTSVNEALLKRGVILRPLLNYGLKTEMRMSVGEMSENQFAITALGEVFEQIKPD